MKNVGMILSLLFLLTVASCRTEGHDPIDEDTSTESELYEPPSNQVACSRAGGEWAALGFGGYKCNVPTKDEGKSCTNASQCESACVVPLETHLEDVSTGTCYGWNLLYGCLAYLNDGGVFVMCRD